MIDGAKIVMVTPCMDMVHTRFFIDAMRLAQRMTYVAMKGGPGFSVLVTQASILSHKRQHLVEQVLEHGWATHILWIDSDMGFEDQNFVLRLLAYDKDIVACACPTKAIPNQSTAVMQRGPNEFEPVSPFTTTGLVPVDFVGMGIMLTSIEVFKKTPSPWFETIYRPERGCYEGEDWYFIRKAREHGFQAYIDAETSQSIEHVGAFAYHHGLSYTEADLGSDLDPEHGIRSGSFSPESSEPSEPRLQGESEGGDDKPPHQREQGESVIKESA